MAGIQVVEVSVCGSLGDFKKELSGLSEQERMVVKLFVEWLDWVLRLREGVGFKEWFNVHIDKGERWLVLSSEVMKVFWEGLKGRGFKGRLKDVKLVLREVGLLRYVRGWEGERYTVPIRVKWRGKDERGEPNSMTTSAYVVDLKRFYEVEGEFGVSTVLNGERWFVEDKRGVEPQKINIPVPEEEGIPF